MINVRIVMYSVPGCPFCKQGREFLRASGASFIELDVTTNHTALCDMLFQFGRAEVPALLAGYKGATGFDAAAWQEILEHAAEVSRTGDPFALPAGFPIDPVKL